jgi:regulator of protease activity HflC (stomatin/prohibitin superfamily)
MTGYFSLATFILFVICVIYLTYKGLYIIQQSANIVVERLGKYYRTLTPGINFTIPFIDTPRPMWHMDKKLKFPDGTTQMTWKPEPRISLLQKPLDFPAQNVITKDNVQIKIDAMMMYQVVDPQRAVYVVENLVQALEMITQTTLRGIIGEMELDETLASRDKINNKVRAALDHATDTWGVRINRVEIQDIIPPEDIRQAMEKQMRAERDKRAVVLEAEGKQTATILEAQGERDAEVSRAEATKRAKILIAEGEAVARIRVAQAEAEAIKKISEALVEIKGNPENYLLLTRYLETLKEMTSGKDNKVVYVPYEATGVLSSLGSIKDLFLGGKQGKES